MAFPWFDQYPSRFRWQRRPGAGSLYLSSVSAPLKNLGRSHPSFLGLNFSVVSTPCLPRRQGPYWTLGSAFIFQWPTLCICLDRSAGVRSGPRRTLHFSCFGRILWRPQYCWCWSWRGTACSDSPIVHALYKNKVQSIKFLKSFFSLNFWWRHLLISVDWNRLKELTSDQTQKWNFVDWITFDTLDPRVVRRDEQVGTSHYLLIDQRQLIRLQVYLALHFCNLLVQQREVQLVVENIAQYYMGLVQDEHWRDRGDILLHVQIKVAFIVDSEWQLIGWQLNFCEHFRRSKLIILIIRARYIEKWLFDIEEVILSYLWGFNKFLFKTL